MVRDAQALSIVWVFDIDDTLAGVTPERMELLRSAGHHGGHACLAGVDDAVLQAFMHPDWLASAPLLRNSATDALQQLVTMGGQPRFLTGRLDSLRTITETWLSNRFGVKPDLWMRGQEHRRSSASEFKRATIERWSTKAPHERYVIYDDDAAILSTLQREPSVLLTLSVL